MSPSPGALRGPEFRWTRFLDEPSPRVVEVDPEDGTMGVLRDATLVVRLSRPVDPTTVAATSLRVETEGADVPARLVVSPDRTMLLWVGQELLTPHAQHTLHLDGVRDLWGEPVEPHASRFVPGDLSSRDWQEPDPREGWIYDDGA